MLRQKQQQQQHHNQPLVLCRSCRLPIVTTEAGVINSLKSGATKVKNAAKAVGSAVASMTASKTLTKLEKLDKKAAKHGYDYKAGIKKITDFATAAFDELAKSGKMDIFKQKQVVLNNMLEEFVVSTELGMGLSVSLSQELRAILMREMTKAVEEATQKCKNNTKK